MNKFLKKITSVLLLPELYIILFGFLINFWYEVSQVPFFLGVNRGQSYFEPNTFETRIFFVQTFNRAAFLDSIIVLGCHVINSILYGSRLWFVRGGSLLGKGKITMKSWIGYLLSAIVASGFLILTEYNAAVNDLWDYHESMPMIWELGLIPIIAMLITPNLSYLLAKLVYKGNIQRRIDNIHDLSLENINDSDQSEKYIAIMKSYSISSTKATKSDWIGISIIGIFLIGVLIWYFGFFS